MARLMYGSVQANQVRIQYYRTGDEKPPVVFLHGLADNGLCWSRLALYLEPDYDVVLVDLRGHGLSEAPEMGYSLADHALDVVTLIEELQLVDPVLIGHSLGADIAANIAAEYPDRVSKLILEDPPWLEQPVDENDRNERGQQVMTWLEGIRGGTLDEVMAEGRQTYPTWDEVDLVQWAKSKQQAQPQAVKACAATPRKPWRDVLKNIKCPVLIFRGDVDKGGMVSQQTADHLAKHLPRGSAIVHIEDAGHNIRRDRFQPVLDIVRKFLA